MTKQAAALRAAGNIASVETSESKITKSKCCKTNSIDIALILLDSLHVEISKRAAYSIGLYFVIS